MVSICYGETKNSQRAQIDSHGIRVFVGLDGNLSAVATAIDIHGDLQLPLFFNGRGQSRILWRESRGNQICCNRRAAASAVPSSGVSNALYAWLIKQQNGEP
jgi:hypothetical protein